MLSSFRIRLVILSASLSLSSFARAVDNDSLPTGKLTLSDLQRQAAKFHTILALPQFESTPEEVANTANLTIAAANKALDAIGALKPDQVAFANTIRALDDIMFNVSQVTNRISILKEAHPDPKIREAAIEALQKFDDWSVGLDYRKDVYNSVTAFAATHPKLQGEDERLLEETLRDYRRAGLDLSDQQQKDIEHRRKELVRLEEFFQININNAATPVKFTKEQLQGVPDSILNKLKTADDEYTVDANVTFQFAAVMDSAVNEETRKRLYILRDSRAKKNVEILRKALELRGQIAQELGYKSSADYRTETRMAKTGDNALQFLEKLKVGLQPKYEAELAEFKAIKAATPGSATPEVNIWDWRFCAEQLRKQKYNIDSEALRVYFPFDKVLQGMFAVYERIFDIQIREVDPPSKYVDDLRLFAVIDKITQQPLGLLYMDMFPRPGKFNHFANFSIIDGKLLPTGEYQRPTTSLICNFPPPSKDGPSLMTHSDVTTIFHEFGHAMHAILTEAKFARFSGTNVPRDFVEAPSQMLEYFTWDKRVLDGFAADYRDPKKKIPQEILAQLKQADLATKATEYRRQLSFGILDLTLHSNLTSEQLARLNDFSNYILGQTFLPPDPSTAFIASFGHLMGYDAGYYGYAWADAIAADMASVFEAAPDGFLDAKVGRRLRDEIYAQGNSRDITESVEKFLGRKQSIQPFLREKLGIQ